MANYHYNQAQKQRRNLPYTIIPVNNKHDISKWKQDADSKSTKAWNNKCAAIMAKWDYSQEYSWKNIKAEINKITEPFIVYKPTPWQTFKQKIKDMFLSLPFERY